MYVCGPTVYDLPHIGHGRYNLVFDVLRRYLLFCGSGRPIRVQHHRRRRQHHQAGRTNRDGPSPRWQPNSRRAGGRPWMASGVLRPDETPHATAYIDRMVDLVGDLMRAGGGLRDVRRCLPRVDTGRRATGSWPARASTRLRAGARVEAHEEKRSPLDFALWKKAKEGEPSWHGALGSGPARMAHRVRGHVARPAGRRVRPPRRRPGPGLPPPRERAGPGRRRGSARSPATGCTTAGSRSRGPRCPSRSATSPRSPTCSPGATGAPTGCWCCGRTTARPSR